MRSKPFVGRRAELALARDLLDRLAAGRGGALIVVGEAGIGKTRLLDEIARLPAALGLLVARAECLPLSTPLPFEAVRELLRKVRGSTQDVSVPADATAGPGLFATVVDEIERIAGEQSALFMVDDLQFSDAATRELVHYCVARLADLPVGWVLAMRPERDVETFVHHLVRADLATELELRGLSLDELRALIVAWLDAKSVDDELATALYARSQGNAFFAEELLRTLEGQGLLEAGKAAALVEPLEGLVPPFGGPVGAGARGAASPSCTGSSCLGIGPAGADPPGSARRRGRSEGRRRSVDARRRRAPARGARRLAVRARDDQGCRLRGPLPRGSGTPTQRCCGCARTERPGATGSPACRGRARRRGRRGIRRPRRSSARAGRARGCRGALPPRRTARGQGRQAHAPPQGRSRHPYSHCCGAARAERPANVQTEC